MFRSCLSCSFYLFASFFLSSPLSFTVYFSPSIFIVRCLFFLIVCCLLFLCLSAGIILVSYWAVAAPLIFCIRKDVVASADRADRCVLCSGALPVLVESWYWFLVLQSIIGTWDVHYRCADCNRAACVFVCLSLGMLLLLERRGVVFYEVRFKTSCAICQCKGTKCRMTNPLGKI